jgi:hypothetical protein
VTQTKDGKFVPRYQPGRENKKLTTKPDLLFILLLTFAVGVAATVLLPLAANDTVAAPASELQAGIIIQE